MILYTKIVKKYESDEFIMEIRFCKRGSTMPDAYQIHLILSRELKLSKKFKTKQFSGCDKYFNDKFRKYYWNYDIKSSQEKAYLKSEKLFSSILTRLCGD